MAKHFKGEVGFTVSDGPLAGDYILLLDFNALCDLEIEFPGIMNGDFEVKSPSAIRKVFAAGLGEHHDGLNERDAGKIIHELGMEKVGALIAEGFAASFPEAAKGEKGPRQAPAKAGAGTGH